MSTPDKLSGSVLLTAYDGSAMLEPSCYAFAYTARGSAWPGEARRGWSGLAGVFEPEAADESSKRDEGRGTTTFLNRIARRNIR
jgi:hypothetical protein